jgi:uncharacterized protein (DUF2345 family)
MAQQEEPQRIDLAVEAEATDVEHAQAQRDVRGEQARPLTVREAPKQASATLDNVTWEFLSRMAAQFLSGNRASLLSGNEPELLSGNQTNLASGNELQLFSGNKINLFSNIRIEIQVSGFDDPQEVMSGNAELRIHRPREATSSENEAIEAELDALEVEDAIDEEAD